MKKLDVRGLFPKPDRRQLEIALAAAVIQQASFRYRLRRAGFDSEPRKEPVSVLDLLLDNLGVPEPDVCGSEGFERGFLYAEWHAVVTRRQLHRLTTNLDEETDVEWDDNAGLRYRKLAERALKRVEKKFKAWREGRVIVDRIADLDRDYEKDDEDDG